MEVSSPLLFVALCLVSLCACRADTVAFFGPSYLKSSTPNRISADGYETLISVAGSSPTPFYVSKATSDEVSEFVVSDVFQRPSVTWNVLLFGATQSEVFGNDLNKADPPMKFVEVYGSAPATGKTHSHKISANCGVECLTESFQEGVKRLGGSYSPGNVGLNGVVKFQKCASHGSELKLDNGALIFWATEMGAVWNDLLKMSFTSGQPMQFSSTLTGLYMIRREYGAASDEFKFAACFTKATLIKIHRTLEEKSGGNGSVFTSVLMHGEPEAIYDDKQLGQALMNHGRSLMTSVNSDNDPMTTVDEKTKRFSTNAIGYVMFLVLLFSSLGSIYAMANMDFTKDTLLYSQAKID